MPKILAIKSLLSNLTSLLSLYNPNVKENITEANTLHKNPLNIRYKGKNEIQQKKLLKPK